MSFLPSYEFKGGDAHWTTFGEFCKFELASGGPDPQLPTVLYMSKGLPMQERLWRAGCYIALHNLPYGELIWRQWDWPSVNSAGVDEIESWFVANFRKFDMRVERRCVRRPDWLTACLVGLRDFIRDYDNLKDRCAKVGDPVLAYDLVWDRAEEVPYFGRYILIKFLELIKRHGELNIESPDIRPAGAWSPRLMLSILWPDFVCIAENSNCQEYLQLVNDLAPRTLKRLSNDSGVDLSLFQLQVLLCEYRECWQSRNYYPGCSLDEELGFCLSAENRWGHKSDMWAARAALFPKNHLGELQGWDNVRKILGTTLADYGYVWSDLKYDYKRTNYFVTPRRYGNG